MLEYLCDSQLVTDCQNIVDIVDDGGITAMIDFSKGFDVVPHTMLLDKLKEMSMDNRVVYFIRKFLKNHKLQVRINEELSHSIRIAPGVP